MSQPSPKIKSTFRMPINSYKISSLRSKLDDMPQLLQQLDDLLLSYHASIEANTKTISGLELLVKSILSNAKRAQSNPYEWLADSNAGKDRPLEGSVFFESKLQQFNEIYSSIASNSVIVDVLHRLKCSNQEEVPLQGLPISSSKKEMLQFYKEATRYYQWKDKMSKDKEKNWRNFEDMLKTNPQLGSCQKAKRQMEEMAKNQELLSKIGNQFSQIERQLLGFVVSDNNLNNFGQIEGKLQKIGAYIKESCYYKQSSQITPKSVKEHTEMIQLLTLLSTSNPGLLQEAVQKQANPQIKSICLKLLSNAIKNNQIADKLYEFLYQHTTEKINYKFMRSVKHFPLERKLAQGEKLIKQMKQTKNRSGLKLARNEEKEEQTLIIKEAQSIDLQQALNNKILESDRQLLLAQESIYSLEQENKALMRQKIEQEIDHQNLHEESQKIRSEKCELQSKLTVIEQKYSETLAANKTLQEQLNTIKKNQHIISSKLIEKQNQILLITESILELTNKFNQITKEKQEIIQHINEKCDNCRICLNVVEVRIDPLVSDPTHIDEVINIIEDGSLLNTPETSKNMSTPPTHKRGKALKHSRSFSNVDFLFELMPEVIEKDLERQNLQGTIDVDELKKAIQIREITIKKYQSFMEKQRKQAKKHRSEILELESKIRTLQLQQIRLNQIIQDQSSEKLLQFDEQGGGSICIIEDSTQKPQQIKSIQKIAEKQVQLKQKQEELNFRVEEIIKHVLKLNTLKVSSHHSSENQIEGVSEDGNNEGKKHPESSKSINQGQ